MTKQRRAIWDLLRSQTKFLSAPEVHDLLLESGTRIGLATVYRNLQALASSGAVDVLRVDNSDVQLFRYCPEKDHHHHLVCRECGTTVDVTGNVLEKWAQTLAREYGFTKVSHSFELFGLCASCSEEENAG
ncbi:MAG: Fur family transcriptional regulator [Arcanobacterium sp.]